MSCQGILRLNLLPSIDLDLIVIVKKFLIVQKLLLVLEIERRWRNTQLTVNQLTEEEAEAYFEWVQINIALNVT